MRVEVPPLNNNTPLDIKKVYRFLRKQKNHFVEATPDQVDYNNKVTEFNEEINREFKQELGDNINKAPSIKLRMIIHQLFREKNSEVKILKLYKPLRTLIVAFYPNLATRRVVFSLMRKELLTRWPDSSKVFQKTYSDLSITHHEANLLNKLDEKRLHTVNEDIQKVVNIEQMKKLIRYLYTQFQESSSDDHIDIMPDCVVAVQLACGSRYSEVMESASYKPAKSQIKGVDFVEITGLLKRKKTAPPIVVKNPIIELSYSELTALVTVIRMERLYASNIAVNRAVRKYFPSDEEKDIHWTSHDMRRAYAGASYVLYAPHTTSLIAWYGRRLGHANGTSLSICTTNYMNMRFVYKGNPIKLNLTDDDVIGLPMM